MTSTLFKIYKPCDDIFYIICITGTILNVYYYFKHIIQLQINISLHNQILLFVIKLMLFFLSGIVD